MRRVYGTKVTRLTLGGLSPCLQGWLPALQGVGMGRQKSADAVVAGSTSRRRAERGVPEEAGLSMMIAGADDDAEMRRAYPEGSGRKPPEQAAGASNITARPQPSTEAEVRLMEKIVSRENMMAAYHRVMANKGAPGIDRMTVEQLKPYLKEHWPRIKEELLDGRYRPQPVRGVEIPKPGGGMRQLGIPTVVDRLIQQAMHQVLMPLFDPDFSQAFLRLPSGAERARCGTCRTIACRRGPTLRGRPRSGKVLRPGEP